MKQECRLSILAGWILAMVISFGSIGCLRSAFDLPVSSPGSLWFCIASIAFFYAAAQQRKYGRLAFACLTALAAGFLFREGTASSQFGELLHRLTTTYDRAYHWGVWTPEARSGYIDLPLGILGTAIAMAVVRTFSRRKNTWFAVLAALIPLAACVVVTDTVPKEGYLFCLMAGLLLLILSASVRRENVLQSIRLTLMIASPVVLALAGLFFAVPQSGYTDQSAMVRETILTTITHLPQLAEQRVEHTLTRVQGTVASRVDLASLGPRIPFSYPVMDITAERSGSLYLRGRDFDSYNGLTWQSTENRQEIFSLSAEAGQTITIHTRNGMDALYLPYYPQENILLTGGSAENAERIHSYPITCGNLPEDWWQRAYVSRGNAVSGLDDYLSLPENTRKRAMQFLSNRLDASAGNTQKAETIASLVKDSAVYSLRPAYMPSGEEDFALWFLEEADSGYCVHFATAATVLLRAAGVPARYVTGYLANTLAGETVTVTEADAHAWAEYYEPIFQCWIPLEATPAAVTPQNIPSETTLPPETLPAETAEVFLQATEAPPQEVSVQQEAQQESKKPSGISGWLLLLLLPVLEIQRSVRMDLRRRRQRKADQVCKALLRWQEAEKLSRLLNESPEEELLSLAQKAKFSQHPLTMEEIQRFDSFNRNCLRRLKEKPWYLRLAYRYGYAVY